MDGVVCEVEDAVVLTSATDGDGGGLGGDVGGAPVAFKLGGDVQRAAAVTAMSMVPSEATPGAPNRGDGGFPSSAFGGTPATLP